MGIYVELGSAPPIGQKQELAVKSGHEIVVDRPKVPPVDGGQQEEADQLKEVDKQPRDHKGYAQAHVYEGRFPVQLKYFTINYI